jgi:uncharacterized membrane protein
LVIARVVHVLGVVLWIGGVAFVTTVLLPAIRKLPTAMERIGLFESLESRFAWQARFTTLITGGTGLYIVHTMNAWSRYLDPSYWWVHLMTLVWLIFTVVLFVLEPLFLHEFFIAQAKRDSERAFGLLQLLHSLLLAISIVAIVGAVAGSRGLLRM